MPQSKIVYLDKKQHSGLTFRPVADYSFTATMCAMPLLLHEAASAATCFPIIFGADNSATPYVMLGLGGKNVFVDDHGGWTASYVPRYADNYPFSLMAVRTSEQKDAVEVILAVDENAPHFQQPNGDALYHDGEPTELLRTITTALGNQHEGYKNSLKPLAELALSNVLREQTVTITAKGKKRSVAGLRVADRNAVMALPDETLGRWAKNGLLELLYAHWGSMRNLQTLLDDPSCPAVGDTKK